MYFDGDFETIMIRDNFYSESQDLIAEVFLTSKRIVQIVNLYPPTGLAPSLDSIYAQKILRRYNFPPLFLP